MALTFVAQGRVLLPDAEPVPAAGVDLAGVQPLAAVEAAESGRASAGVSVRDELADAAVDARVGIASRLDPTL